MATNSIICLAIVAASLVSVYGQRKPGFCKNYDCPLFTTQRFDGYEMRSYGETKWISISKVTASSDSASNGMFMKLFNYIGGENSAGQKIKMTVPVATKVEAVGGGQYRYSMMFYVTDNNPPTPNDPDLSIVTMPARDVYVRTFYKWIFMASNNDYMSEVDELRASLARDGKDGQYDTSSYYQVGYSSPFWPLRKHHEVWLDSV